MTIATQLGRINASIEMSSKVREFCNLARVVALSRGDVGTAKAIVHDHRVLMGPRLQSIVERGLRLYEMPPDVQARQKAAIAAGATSDPSWAGPLAEYNILAGAFVESLRNFGAFDAMLPAMRRVPFRVRIGASTIGITGTTVPQASAKPISKLSLSGTQISERKAIALLVVTDELARFGDVVAGNLFAVELSNAVAVETDQTFTNTLIFNAPVVGSSGTTAEHVRNDLRAMLAAITTSARSQLFLLMPSAIAKTLAVLHDSSGSGAFPTMNYNGGSIGGIVALVSDGVLANTMVLVDGQQVAAASETIQLSASNEAIVQMDSAPDSPPTASTPMTSLWQNNLSGLKAERTFGVEKLTAAAAVVLTNVAYVGDSPGP